MKKSEPILRRTPTNEDAPPLPRSARQPQRKMFLAFRICARPISSKKERTFFFGVLPSKYSGKWRGDNSIRSGMAEFPHTPLPPCPRLDERKFRRRHCYLFFLLPPLVPLNLPLVSRFGVCFFGIVFNDYSFYKSHSLINLRLRRRPLEKTSCPLA